MGRLEEFRARRWGVITVHVPRQKFLAAVASPTETDRLLLLCPNHYNGVLEAVDQAPRRPAAVFERIDGDDVPLPPAVAWRRPRRREPLGIAEESA